MVFAFFRWRAEGILVVSLLHRPSDLVIIILLVLSSNQTVLDTANAGQVEMHLPPDSFVYGAARAGLALEGPPAELSDC